jgi:hypothetical protein
LFDCDWININDENKWYSKESKWYDSRS